MPSSRRSQRPSHWPDWFQPKGYPHFDLRIHNPDAVRSLVESSTAVARHAFFPFIHFVAVTRKYKRDERRFVKKRRPLSYASHVDSQIFRRYSLLLGQKYEELVVKEKLEESVLAYRRFNPPRCNVEFANRAFLYIEEHAPCVALAFDLKDFFESLDHKMLKRQWKCVLGVQEVPADHYAVFKAVTRYAYVERERLYKLFGITNKKLKTWNAPICSPDAFRDQVRAGGLINTKQEEKGVPQGSPISALLSNVYMAPVDVHMAALVSTRGGLYLRYSDDIRMPFG